MFKKFLVMSFIFGLAFESQGGDCKLLLLTTQGIIPGTKVSFKKVSDGYKVSEWVEEVRPDGVFSVRYGNGEGEWFHPSEVVPGSIEVSSIQAGRFVTFKRVSNGYKVSEWVEEVRPDGVFSIRYGNGEGEWIHPSEIIPGTLEVHPK